LRLEIGRLDSKIVWWGDLAESQKVRHDIATTTSHRPPFLKPNFTTAVDSVWQTMN